MEEKEKSKEYDNSRTVCPWAEVILNAKIIAVTKTRLLLTILRGKSVKKEWNIIHPPWPVWIGLNYNLFSLVFSLHFSTADDTPSLFFLSLFQPPSFQHFFWFHVSFSHSVLTPALMHFKIAAYLTSSSLSGGTSTLCFDGNWSTIIWKQLQSLIRLSLYLSPLFRNSCCRRPWENESRREELRKERSRERKRKW